MINTNLYYSFINDKNYFKKHLLIVVLVSVFFSCSKDDNRLNIDVSTIASDVKIERFEQEFYTAKPENLPKLKEKYPFLFPHNIDSVWVNKMSDKDEQELFKATQKVYPNLDKVKKDLDELFKHVKYYYPKFKEPRIITLNSNVGFEQKVIYTNELLFISLDVFLGKDSYIYEDYPAYLTQNFTPKQITVATAKEIIKPILFKNKNRTFSSKIIQEGKKLYALDAFLPNFNDEDKIGYTPNKTKWVKANEYMIWSYFVDKELLYSTDNSLNTRFIDLAPFSKFYLDIDNKSPGSVGSWLGWQIVRSFMKYNKDVSLTELMKMDNETIFKKSKYKPNRY